MLVYLNEQYNQYLVLTVESRLHVVRSDCLEAVGVVSKDKKQLMALAIMDSTELCQTRKVRRSALQPTCSMSFLIMFSVCSHNVCILSSFLTAINFLFTPSSFTLRASHTPTHRCRHHERHPLLDRPHRNANMTCPERDVQ